MCSLTMGTEDIFFTAHEQRILCQARGRDLTAGWKNDNDNARFLWSQQALSHLWTGLRYATIDKLIMHMIHSTYTGFNPSEAFPL